MATIAQNTELLKHFFSLLESHREVVKQQRSFERVKLLALSEVFTFGRHTITQQLMSLGLNEGDWSAWHRLFNAQRFSAQAASVCLFRESLKEVGAEAVYVVAGDATQTPRSSGKMEGVGWLKNPRTPPFRVGIHYAQQWFHGSWLLPSESGYTRAIPLQWLPAFTEKSQPKTVAPTKEWEAGLAFVGWVRDQLDAAGREQQSVLMVGDGHYDNVKLWQNLPERVCLVTRSAKNRVLYHLPDRFAHGNRKYGERAPTPEILWRERQRWTPVTLTVRGLTRHLKVLVKGVLVRQGAPDCPLFLIIVRGKRSPHARRTRYRPPLPFLVNAVQDEHGQWKLPLPLETLLFWLWQRWEVEVCHRELKTTFGLGHKQAFNPHAAILSVQWSAWVYALLMLAGYRTFGYSRAPDVPSRWWRGHGRWSFSTLLRAFRAALWGAHHFRPLCDPSLNDGGGKSASLDALFNSVFAATYT